MRVIVPGHIYALNWLDVSDGELKATEGILEFVKREGEGYPGNDGHHPGTTTQEVLRALIDRTQYVNKQIPDTLNDNVIQHLRHAIYTLELRAAKRHDRVLHFIETVYMVADNFNAIERLPVCVKCGHIGCEGACHD